MQITRALQPAYSFVTIHFCNFGIENKLGAHPVRPQRNLEE